MRFIKAHASLPIRALKKQFEDWWEFESHSPWDIFKEYTSARTGLHLYDKGSFIIEYWESGERNR